jgi:hypothetical protein
MHEPAPFRVLKAGDGLSLLRIATSLAIDTMRAELIQAQRQRNIAEQAAQQFCAADLDGKLD